MKIEFKHRWSLEILFSGEFDSPKEAAESAVKNGVNLDGVNLDGASLNGASLNRASLNGASLNGASLDGASLDGASLDGASLDGVNLDGASLNGASLNGASLNGNTVMPHGETWSRYQTEVVPAILQAGGKTIADILATNCWDCHEWSNCPMHAAFGINSDSDGPILLRPRIKEFVQFFDAGLIPKPSA